MCIRRSPTGPVRIEFFGDEIETIRKFDPETQRSQSGLDEAQLLPLDGDAGNRAPACGGACDA
jgi:transcription-repair coupling factor (superfamily II helicase)